MKTNSDGCILNEFPCQCAMPDCLDCSVAPNCSKAGGNTKTPASSRFWTFTLNNYTVEDIDQIQSCSSVPFIRFQTEIGEDNGVPHLQGAIAYGKGCKGRPFSLGWTRDIHWEKKIKKSTPFQMFAYCKKEKSHDGKIRYDFGNIDDTFKDTKSKKIIVEEEIYCEEPNPKLKFIVDLIDNYDYFKGDRKLHIVIDKVGGLGKTELCRWLHINRERVIVSGGKASDMKNQIVEYKKTNGVHPKIVLFDVPRFVGSDYLSYGGIEEIKNMFFYSGKYEGGMINGNKPFVLILMNDLPDLTKWSEDRLEDTIYEIHNEGIAIPDEAFGLDDY